MADTDLTEDQVADLKEAFAMFDINGDGKFILSICSFCCLELPVQYWNRGKHNIHFSSLWSCKIQDAKGQREHPSSILNLIHYNYFSHPFLFCFVI